MCSCVNRIGKRAFGTTMKHVQMGWRSVHNIHFGRITLPDIRHAERSYVGRADTSEKAGT